MHGMAQWAGQFTGRTHVTRVADAEVALRRAADALHAEPTEAERVQRAQIVRDLAERIVVLRLRMIKARLVALRADDHIDSGNRSFDPEARAPLRPATESTATLRAREEHVREAGVLGVLREFGVEEAWPK